MSARHFEHLSMHFDVEDKRYMIKGLKAENITVKNSYLSDRTVMSGTWESRLASSGMHDVSLSVFGDYHKSGAQDALQNAAFANTPLLFKFMIDGKSIAGKFLITKYEISARFDDFLEFEIAFENASRVIFSNKSV